MILFETVLSNANCCFYFVFISAFVDLLHDAIVGVADLFLPLSAINSGSFFRFGVVSFRFLYGMGGNFFVMAQSLPDFLAHGVITVGFIVLCDGFQHKFGGGVLYQFIGLWFVCIRGEVAGRCLHLLLWGGRFLLAAFDLFESLFEFQNIEPFIAVEVGDLKGFGNCFFLFVDAGYFFTGLVERGLIDLFIHDKLLQLLRPSYRKSRAINKSDVGQLRANTALGYQQQQNIMNNLLVLLLLTVIVKGQQIECWELVQDWISDPTKLQPLVYADSGRFLNDLGDYNNCIFNKDEYVYFTVNVVNRLVGAYQNMGLCAPLACHDILASNQLAQPLQNLLNEVFQNSTNSTFSPFVRLNFYNPVEAQPQFDWSSYLVIALLIVLVTLGIVGSLIGRITKSEGLPVRALKCFSFYDNFGKIIAISQHTQNQNLLFLNGARVLSIFWIVFGHDQWFRFMNIKNWTETIDILTTPGIPTMVPAAYFAVDTFFWIGGFLITLGMLQQVRKARNFVKFYLGCFVHRFIRIWPTYMLAILIFWKVAPFMGSGPIWRTFYNLSCSCNDWGVVSNMLFIDNFGDHGPNGMDYCFGWGWYLAVDFQLFMITPFILYAYAKSKKLGWIVTFLLFCASVITAFVIVMVEDYRYPIPNPKFAPQPLFMDDFYYKPYIRASAYFMGIFSGYIYLEWKNNDPSYLRVINKIKNSVVIRVIFYVVGVTLVVGTIWIIVPFQTGGDWSTLQQALYNSLNRVFFLLGMYLCVFAAMFGCKYDPSKYILGHWIFSPLAKVSFCLYLTHFIVIMNGTFANRMDMFWQSTTSMYTVITDIFWGLIFATCLSLLIESPTLGLQKIFLRPSRGKKIQKLIDLSVQKQNQAQLNTPLMGSQDSVELRSSEIVAVPTKQQVNMLL